MVQEIAQEIIRSARKKGAQDIYFVPKLDAYELHMRVGDERCKIGSYDFEKFAAVISHFKFVAGMNVGEKDVVNWVPVIMPMTRRWRLYVYLL